MDTNTIHVFHAPAPDSDPWKARLGGADGPTASGLTPISALCALTLALQSTNHPFSPNWSPDAPEPEPAPAPGDAS